MESAKEFAMTPGSAAQISRGETEARTGGPAAGASHLVSGERRVAGPENAGRTHRVTGRKDPPSGKRNDAAFARGAHLYADAVVRELDERFDRRRFHAA